MTTDPAQQLSLNGHQLHAEGVVLQVGPYQSADSELVYPGEDSLDENSETEVSKRSREKTDSDTINFLDAVRECSI